MEKIISFAFFITYFAVSIFWRLPTFSIEILSQVIFWSLNSVVLSYVILGWRGRCLRNKISFLKWTNTALLNYQTIRMPMKNLTRKMMTIISQLATRMNKFCKRNKEIYLLMCFHVGIGRPKWSSVTTIMALRVIFGVLAVPWQRVSTILTSTSQRRHVFSSEVTRAGHCPPSINKSKKTHRSWK